ncbi:MAG: Histone acetyltransferase, ELP3 family [Candidatus Moranbacteria bacterium GW2011_GWC2_37_73]|nr:MAG: Histone acetyltransferase, ELP3 family [Parcubacteria group bacterium GW2011_GWC1_36_108]KKQ01195.1 MAG: Histone acetyltransferase, ELP3 family [Candidatus Moranbacteria bacterium GW2011_GWD1_36_198]KKQ02396.1 MAG: Histone acetyltransferase, ELP3 family [Candidatus Moranbacteria bacterium GW2011_GWD2_36_198]KKQ40071.1 MAG: Histone acetyltransferase, ELP3 family [Candidatus Moranbacteria bacterium GW2011_GWC2_37_73]HAR99541.1 tRNA uridine(34) 5-carboxymethylaminomethyl modification radic
MNLLYDNYIISAINELSENQGDFGKLKKSLCKKFGVAMPTNADLRDRYNKLVQQKKIKRSEKFEEALMSRLIRTQSGVAVVAVLTKSYPCPGKCIYCPSEKDMPKSYLSNEPAVMRAIDSQFDPYRQMQNRLRSLELNGHRTDKIELIVMGGTFSFLPKNYQKKFITRCFQGANEYKSYKVHKVIKFIKSVRTPNEELLYQQKKNESANHRIIGLTLETRPDYIDEKEILNFRQLGCTRVELGVQSLYDNVLELNKRGHLIQSTIEATKMLKDSGFKINYHMMPGLPGSTPKRDFEMFKALFEGPKFQPDMLKIYPTVVLKNSELYNIWKKNNYVPLTNQAFERLVVKIKNEAITPYVRIARLIRDVPTPSIIAGPTVSNLRQIIIPQSNCPCIRCREVGAGYTIKEEIILDRIDYAASDGTEIFLQYVSPDKKKLFALLRLRIPSENNAKHFIGTLKNAAIIREVHTYGKLTKIDTQDSTSPQHIGLGKKLLLEAEKIAKEEYSLEKIAVISGVGVRGYYRKQGYKLNQTYLVKKI